MVITELLKLK